VKPLAIDQQKADTIARYRSDRESPLVVSAVLLSGMRV